MRPFPIDFTNLTPAPGAPFAPFVGLPPRSRFEDHLGSAAGGWRDRPIERAAPASKPEPATDRASENGAAPASTTPGDEAKRNADDDKEEGTASGAAAQESTAAGVQANQQPPQKPAAEARDNQSAESNTEPGDGKVARLKRKLAHANAGADNSVGSRDPVANENAAEGIQGATAAEKTNRAGTIIDGRSTDDEAAGEKVETESVSVDASGEGVVAAIAVEGAVKQSGNPDEAAKDGTESEAAIGSASVEQVERQGGSKRARGAKSAESSNTTVEQQIEAATSADVVEQGAGAATTAQTIATVELEATEDAASREDAAAGDAGPTSNSDTSEARPGGAPALFAARQNRSHEPGGRSEGLTEAERVRFVQRVARAFHSVGEEGGEVRLRLSPPELGSLRLELSVRDGVMSARLEAETTAARNLLLDNLPVLRERLAEQNVKVERFDVDVREEQRQNSREDFAGQADLPRQGRRDRHRAQEARPATAPVQRIARGATSHADSGQLNIII